jgi:hypothetical protein
LNLFQKTTELKKKEKKGRNQWPTLPYPCRLHDHIQVLPKSGDF